MASLDGIFATLLYAKQASLLGGTITWSSSLHDGAYLLLVLLTFQVLRWSLIGGQGNAEISVPIVGPKNCTLARYSFFGNALLYVEEGYAKYRNTLFKLSGQDILIIPNKYVDELRNVPDHKLSSIQANIDNFEGLYSTTSILLEGHLHTHTIQTRLTPRLASLVPVTQSVLNKAFVKELPADKDTYVDMPAFHLVLRLVSAISARHFVGHPMCEDENWLSTALKYTENAFRTIIFLRIFPDWAKPMVSFLIPYSWKVSSALRNAQRLIVPIIIQRRKEAVAALSTQDSSYGKPDDFLQWMMDEANERDGLPHKLAHRLLILTLASVHTTSMAVTQTLFDLCARPEYIAPLREEITKVMQKDGGFTKQTLTHLRKLDSFMRESQRLNPPSLLGFKRCVREPLTLSDGVFLPKNTHLMMPVYPIVIDEANVPDPMRFDGFRHYNNRLQPGESNKHQFATTSNKNLHFGHGKFSCPGRFFAANTIKMIISNLLLRYDFHLEGSATGSVERPENVRLHEYVFPNPEAKVLFKLREVEPVI